jgi:hypothetical protein
MCLTKGIGEEVTQCHYTNLLCSCVCSELKYLILKSKRIGEDAHLIWKLPFELVHTKWDEIESDDEDEPAEMCPTTSTPSTGHQESTLKQEEDQRSEEVVPLQGPVRPVPAWAHQLS